MPGSPGSISNDTGTISPSGPSATRLRGDGRAAAGRVLRAAARELDFDRLAGVTVGLQIAGDVERVVRKRAGRHDQVAERDVALRRRPSRRRSYRAAPWPACAASIAALGSTPAFCAPSEITTTPASGASRYSRSSSASAWPSRVSVPRGWSSVDQSISRGSRVEGRGQQYLWYSNRLLLALDPRLSTLDLLRQRHDRLNFLVEAGDVDVVRLRSSAMSGLSFKCAHDGFDAGSRWYRSCFHLRQGPCSGSRPPARRLANCGRLRASCGARCPGRTRTGQPVRDTAAASRRIAGRETARSHRGDTATTRWPPSAIAPAAMSATGSRSSSNARSREIS